MAAAYFLPVEQLFASGPRTTMRPLAVVEERPHAVLVSGIGWIDRAFVVAIPMHSCDESCHCCWRCYQASGADVCNRTCKHAEED